MTARLATLFNQNLIKVVGIILAASLLLFTVILAFIWLMFSNFKTIVDNQFTVAHLSDQVVWLDEVLTMSARMNALTGDTTWQARYEQYVPQLDDIVKQLHQLAPEGYEAFVQETDAANVALVEMEMHSFDLVKQGKAKEAVGVLLGSEYQKQKKIYSDGIQEVLKRSQTDADAQFRAFEGRLLASGVAGLIILPLLLVSFTAMFTRLNSYLKARQKAEDDLRESAQKLHAVLLEREHLIKELESAVMFKDQFLATMSHELRTPMNAVLGYTGIILQEEGLDDDVVNMLNRIKNNSSRLLNLINDVLDISRINANRVEIVARPVALHTLAQNWYRDFQVTADNRKLHFEFSIDPDLPQTILGDEERLTQITANLLQNAFKFTEKGSVGLRVERRDQQLAIIVSDTGLGIPDTWRYLIFEEFRQVDGSSRRKYGGAGLGLSIVQKLCLLMGGSVTVNSKLSEGSTFTVLLPLTISQVQPQVA